MRAQVFKKSLLLVISLFLLLNAGCWDRREINDSAVPTIVGSDLADDNKEIRFSALFAQPKPPGESGSSQMQSILITSNGYSVSLAARRLALSFSRVPDWAHVKNVILGENLSRNNLTLVIDFMTRNRNIPYNTNLLVTSKNKPEDVMAQAGKTDSNLTQLVIFNEYQQGIYVPISVGEFVYALMTPGVEPAVPQITLQDDSNIKAKNSDGDKNAKRADNKSKRVSLSGTAVFKRDKMLGSLNEYESRGYRWLKSRTKTGGIIVIPSPLHANENIVLEIAHFSSKTKPQLSDKTLQMDIEIKAHLTFYEEAGSGELLTPAMFKKLEKAADTEIRRQVNACIHQSQNFNSDILGWGLLLQEHKPEIWKQMQSEWDDQYPLIDFNVEVQTKILHTYMSNRVLQIR